MDLHAFGFRSQPFRPTPNAGLFFPSSSHSTACEAALTGYARQTGVVLIDGESGTGKTLVGLRMLAQLPASAKPVMVQTPRNVRPDGLLQAILFDLAKPYQSLSEQELRLAVHEEVLRTLEAGQSMVLFIDEGHNLTSAALEELRLLGNLGVHSADATFVVIAGLPSMKDMIAAENPAFNHRIGGRLHIVPLSHDESMQYIDFHVQAAGGPHELFNDEALELLATHTHGVPRLLNRAASMAIHIAASAGVDEIDAEPVMDALSQLGLMTEEADEVKVERKSPDVLQHPGSATRVERTQSPTRKWI